MNVRLIITAAVCSVSGMQACADDGPSYEDTLNFINSKLVTTLSASSSYSKTQRKFSLTEVTRCVFVYKDKFRSKDEDGYLNENMQISFDFKTIDPSKVKISTRNSYYNIRPVSLTTREEHRSIKITRKPASGCTHKYCKNSTENSSFFTMYSREPERLQKALIHITKLCGGKEELF